ncbi:MAG: ABC transporter permease [Clostridia bacterium]|nr:ABC transporter permease [Clostridia bacterium]
MMKDTARISANKEPLIHITKRDNLTWKNAILVRVLAIILAFIVTAIVIVCMTGKNPFEVFGSMFSGAFGSPLRMWILFSNTAILLGIALALTPAFKMKFWNCGGEGQVLVGALATTCCMLFIGDSIPLPLLYIVMIITSVAAGAIWGIIPSIFKALWNTNETLFTLMMNYIAIQLIVFFLKLFGDNGSGTLSTMKEFAVPHIFGDRYFFNILVVAIICALMYIYLRYSKHGYEISVVGESENTARYVGINVRKVIIRTMLVSGALCGVIGFLLVANGSCTISSDLAGGQGFTAIMVSWLAKFNPLFMVLTAFLIIFLQRGTNQIAIDFRVDTSLCDIIIGIILFFIIGCEFFIQYKVHFGGPLKPIADAIGGFFNKIGSIIKGIFTKKEKEEVEE